MLPLPFNLLLKQFISHPNQLITLLPRHPNRPLNITSKFLTILRSNKIYIILVTVEGIDVLAVFYDCGECAWVCAGLETAADVFVLHERGDVIEAVL